MRKRREFPAVSVFNGQEERKGGKAAGKARTPEEPGRTPAGEGRGRKKSFSGEIISPEPPYLAGRKARGCKSFSFGLLLFQAVLCKRRRLRSFYLVLRYRCSAEGRSLPHAARRTRAGRGKRCRTVEPPGLERPGVQRFDRKLRVSVSCRTRSRRPTPSRRCRAVVSKEGM